MWRHKYYYYDHDYYYYYDYYYYCYYYHWNPRSQSTAAGVAASIELVYMTACTCVGKRLQTLPSHPTLSEPGRCGWKTQTYEICQHIIFRALLTARKNVTVLISDPMVRSASFINFPSCPMVLYFKRKGTRDTNNDSDFYLWIVFQSVTAFGVDIEQQTTPNIISSICFSSVSGSIPCWHSQGFCSPRKSSVLIKTIFVLICAGVSNDGL